MDKTATSVTQNERNALIIVRQLLREQESELYLHPKLNKRYIKSEKHKMYVVLQSEPHEINIINHKYSYLIKLGERTHNNIVSEFDSETERRRLAMEYDFTNNIEHSLNKIVHLMNNKNMYSI